MNGTGPRRCDAYLLFGFAVLPPPTIDAAIATAPETAPVAVLATLRMARLVAERFFAAADPVDAGVFAGFDAALAACGFTFFGAALPNDFFASFERAAVAGPASDLAWVALLFLGAAFLAVVAMTLSL